MRQISDVRARALDDLAVGVEQRVGLARERRDLFREFSFQPLGTARSDGGEPIGDALERRKAETDLECRGEEQN